MESLQSLNQPKIFTRDSSGFFITITVNKCKWDKFQLLLHFHHYPKDTFLTSDYVGLYFLSANRFFRFQNSPDSFTMLPQIWSSLGDTEKPLKNLYLFFPHWNVSKLPCEINDKMCKCCTVERKQVHCHYYGKLLQHEKNKKCHEINCKWCMYA